LSQTTPADFAGFEVAGEQLPADFPVGEASDAELQSVLDQPVPPGADSSSGVIALDDFEVGEQTNYSANITPVSDAEFDAIESMFTRMDNFQEYGPFRKGTGLKLEGDGTSFSVLKPWENPNFDYTASLVTGTASPVVGNPNAGIWKRLDNTLTGGLFLNNNSVVDQADTEAYSNTFFFGIDGVTHGDVYDASMATAEYLGYAELGLAVGSLKAFVRNLDADNAKYAADSSAPNNLDNAAAPGPVNFMADSDRFFINSSRRPDIDPDGYFDVVAHGSPNRIQIETTNGPVLVDHRTAARLIQQQPGYNGQNIRLFSCSTGACDTGFAQNLANKLNVEVQAPTDLLWAYPSGRTLVAPKAINGQPDLNSLGEIRNFLPKKGQ
ncbi:MAG: hypothetical protein AB2806_15945, partial [Candidatus Thiodiazotropha sp.]